MNITFSLGWHIVGILHTCKIITAATRTLSNMNKQAINMLQSTTVKLYCIFIALLICKIIWYNDELKFKDFFALLLNKYADYA